MTEVVGRVAVLGAGVRVQGFALAGAFVSIADDEDAVRSAWQDLPSDTAVVVLTPEAAQALADVLPDTRRLTVVMP
jgi:vacuolar-type H+-ATPase subunit F/Vma7